MMEEVEQRAALPQEQDGFDANTLKLIAIVGMTLDHIGIVLGEYLPLWAECLLYTPGGLTFPIMAFLMCEGFRHTRSVTKYALRLLVFALIALIPYMWVIAPAGNVLFTFLLCLLALVLTQKIKSPLLSGLIFFVMAVLSAKLDWGLMAVPMVLMYYYIYDRKMKVILPVFVPFLFIIMQVSFSTAMMGQAAIEELLPTICFILIGCTATIPLLYRYNGQRGKKSRNPKFSKYAFYVYYPVHLVLLGLVRGLFFGNWGTLF